MLNYKEIITCEPSMYAFDHPDCLWRINKFKYQMQRSLGSDIQLFYIIEID